MAPSSSSTIIGCRAAAHCIEGKVAHPRRTYNLEMKRFGIGGAILLTRSTSSIFASCIWCTRDYHHQKRMCPSNVPRYAHLYSNVTISENVPIECAPLRSPIFQRDSYEKRMCPSNVPRCVPYIPP